MANRKISDLTALTAPVTGDLLPIVDISEAAAADKNKKITYGTFLSSVPLGTAAAPSIAFTGDNTGIYSPGADQLAVSTGGTGRLFVDASGNVGIGTSSPIGALDVAVGGAGPGRIVLSQTSDNPWIDLYRGDGSGGFTAFRMSNGNAGIGELVFSAATSGSFGGYTYTERLRIDSSGNVGIGTSSPSTLLDVNADTVRVRTARTPASASATGAAGEICWDANYIYVCTATNTWKRTAIATW